MSDFHLILMIMQNFKEIYFLEQMILKTANLLNMFNKKNWKVKNFRPFLSFSETILKWKVSCPNL